MVRDDNFNNSLIGPSVWHRSIDGDTLVEVRHSLSVSQQVFADLAGHSRQFQTQLEAPGLHEISKDKADQITAAIEHFKNSIAIAGNAD